MNCNRILYVEDNVVFAMFNADFFRACGLVVIHASSAEEAMAILRTSPETLAALVTDVQLGRGPTGFELARLARLSNPDLAVMFTSGSNRERHAVEGVAGSVFIAKPYHPLDVVEALLSITERQSA